MGARQDKSQRGGSQVKPPRSKLDPAYLPSCPRPRSGIPTPMDRWMSFWVFFSSAGPKPGISALGL